MRSKFLVSILAFILASCPSHVQAETPRPIFASSIYNGSGVLYVPTSTPLGDRACVLDQNSALASSITTTEELAFVHGVTSSIQAQLNTLFSTSITALTGDVSAVGPGSVTATVNSVGGSTAANVHAADVAVQSASSSNTASTIVKRDSSGNFSASTVTANLTGNVSGNLTGNVTGNLTGNVTGNVSGSASSFTGSLSGDVTGTQSATAISAATVTGKAITGYVSGAGTLTATDSILSAIDKLDGNTTAISSQKGQPNGYATLDASGLLPTSELPPLAITDTYVVASQAAMLALSAHVGDVAVRTDISQNFILQTAGPSLLGHWVQLLTPAAPVQSVNGQTGNVNLTTSDISEGSNLYFTNARAQSAISATSPLTYSSGTVGCQTASGSQAGCLSSADWSIFNGKQSALTFGNLTDVGTDGITVTGGTGSVIGSGTSLSQHVADSLHNGYLSSADWSTFNGKQASGNYITALTSDVSASGPGSAAATVNSVGGSTASNVHSAELAANAATSANTASTIVKRDASGNFSAGTISLGSGTSSAPSYTFSSSTGTGLYLPGSSILGVDVGGLEIGRWVANGLLIGTTTNDTLASLRVANASNNFNIRLDSNTGHPWYITANGVTFDLYDGGAPFFQYSDTTGFYGLSAVTPHYWFDVAAGSASTSLPSKDGSIPVLAVRNTNSTAGNDEAMVFSGSSANPVATITAFNDTQTSGSEAAHLSFHTVASGTLTEALRLKTDQTVQMPHYGLGLAHLDSSGNITSSAVVSGDFSGQLGLSKGGTNADLSATGGTHQVVQQASLGAAFTVGQLACADLSNSSASCSTDTTNASNISSGTLGAARLPNPTSSTLGGVESYAAVTSQWINSISTSGVPSSTQPAFTDISGTAAATQGGTGQSTYTLGDLLYSSASNTLSKLAGNTTSTKKFLTQTGTGTVSAAPSWLQPACGDLSNSAASCSTDTTNAANISSGNLSLSRLPSAVTWPSSGTVQSVTPTNHGVVVSGSGASASVTSAGTSGQLLIGQGATSDPSFNTMSGDVTITNAGVATIANSAVTAGKMSSGAASNGQVATANGSGGVTYTSPSVVLSVVSKTSAYTITTSDDVVLADSTSAAFTLTLPDATTATKKHYVIINKGGSLANAVTLSTVSSQTIGGSGTSRTMYTLNEEFDLIPDGTNWQIYNHKTATAHVSYSPTWSGFSIGNGTVSGFWWRQGDQVCVQASAVFGSTSTFSSSFDLTLPSNISFDTAKVTNSSNVTGLGQSVAFISGVANYSGSVIYQSTTTVRAEGPSSADVWGKVGGVGYPNTWNTSSWLSYNFCGPVSGWYE